MGVNESESCERDHSMQVDIERILFELEKLPRYDTQISLQLTQNGSSGEGKLTDLEYQEKDFNVCAYDLPYTNSIIENLQLYRTRVMRMKPKTCYSYHQDPTQRIHIPLITNDKCFFVINDEVLRCPANGQYYLIDTRKKHTFVNASFEERIHIIGCIN